MEQPDTVARLVQMDGSGDLTLFENVLEDCLLDDAVKDLPVFVISVIGDQRTGKSFLLNYILRYLRNQRKQNWMGKEDETLTGFGWKPGSEGTTSGIMILKKPFVVDSSIGKVAVLLVDMEGLQNLSSSKKRLTKLATITRLVSTLQIFNVMRNLKESDLANFELFAYVASKAEESSPVPEEGTPSPEKETPETLNLGIPAVHFVVRDFIERKSGFEEGQRHLESRLKGKAAGNRWASLCELMKGVPMKCFLMLYPGDSVSEDETYKGQTKGMKSEFKDQLNAYISSLLSDDFIKEAVSSKRTCKDLETRTKAVVEKLQKKKIKYPSPLKAGEPGLECVVKRSSVKRKECMEEIKKFSSNKKCEFEGMEKTKEKMANNLEQKIQNEKGPYWEKYEKMRVRVTDAEVGLGTGLLVCVVAAAISTAVAYFGDMEVTTAVKTGAGLGTGSRVVVRFALYLVSLIIKLKRARPPTNSTPDSRASSVCTGVIIGDNKLEVGTGDGARDSKEEEKKDQRIQEKKREAKQHHIDRSDERTPLI
ncbi:atlastin-2 isoform X2 [Latimeria chalumnae]